jgi:flagellar basal body rod protein FlgC
MVEVRDLKRRSPRRMMQVFAIASNALVVQSQKLGEIAAAVAGTGATRSGAANAPDGTSPVRIGALPVGGAIENMVSLKEVEMAYRMNAAVIATADEMFDALLDMIDADRA